MNKKRNCLIGRDSDDSGCIGMIIGVMIAIAIAIAVIMTIMTIMCFAGIFIGGFHSLKNYFVSLKHNVIDSNVKPAGAV